MMKKYLLIVLNVALTLGVFAQKAAENTAQSANPDFTTAQKSTLALVKLYDLSGEQARETLKIQQTKVQNLAGIESMKAKDLSAYAQKRLSAMNIAANEFSTLLDARQMKIFKQEQAENVQKIGRITQGLKKSGAPESEINKQLSALEF